MFFFSYFFAAITVYLYDLRIRNDNFSPVGSFSPYEKYRQRYLDGTYVMARYLWNLNNELFFWRNYYYEVQAISISPRDTLFIVIGFASWTYFLSFEKLYKSVF